MDIIRKISAAALALVMCTTLCACSTVKKANVDSDRSGADSTGNSDDQALSEPPVTVTREIQIPQGTASANDFTAAGLQGITDDDKDTLVSLCNLMCHKWAKSCLTKKEYDYTGLVNNSNFVKYLNLVSLNGVIACITDSYDAKFALESMTVDGSFATMTGSYHEPIHSNTGGAYGNFTFIVENVNGRFYVNDMFYLNNMIEESPDYLVRPDFVDSPTPNYWQSDENLAAAEKILTGVQ